MQCSDNFWLWFMRPLAEFLGALSLGIGLIAAIFLIVGVITIYERITKK